MRGLGSEKAPLTDHPFPQSVTGVFTVRKPKKVKTSRKNRKNGQHSKRGAFSVPVPANPPLYISEIFHLENMVFRPVGASPKMNGLQLYDTLQVYSIHRGFSVLCSCMYVYNTANWLEPTNQHRT